MNKKIIAAAVAAMIAAPAAMAASSVTFYGKVQQSVDAIDVGTTDTWMINDRTSRLGFMGSEDLGDGLKAVFKIETAVNISQNAGTTFSEGMRNSYVGLAGDFGTVLIGRHDAPHSLAWSKNDMFADTVADLNANQIENEITWTRVDGTIAYISPSFSGLTVALALVPGEDQANGDDGLADTVSGALMYSNGGIYASVGHLSHQTDNMDETNVSVRYTMDAITVGATYVEDDAGNTQETETWIINGSYTMGNNKIKLQYTDQDEPGSTLDSDKWAIGLDHMFSKRTKAQLTYMSSDADDAANDGDIFSIQMNHSF